VDTIKAECRCGRDFGKKKARRMTPQVYRKLEYCGAHIFPSVFTAKIIAACVAVTVVPT